MKNAIGRIGGGGAKVAGRLPAFAFASTCLGWNRAAALQAAWRGGVLYAA